MLAIPTTDDDDDDDDDEEEEEEEDGEDKDDWWKMMRIRMIGVMMNMIGMMMKMRIISVMMRCDKRERERERAIRRGTRHAGHGKKHKNPTIRCGAKNDRRRKTKPIQAPDSLI